MRTLGYPSTVFDKTTLGPEKTAVSIVLNKFGPDLCCLAAHPSPEVGMQFWRLLDVYQLYRTTSHTRHQALRSKRHLTIRIKGWPPGGLSEPPRASYKARRKLSQTHLSQDTSSPPIPSRYAPADAKRSNTPPDKLPDGPERPSVNLGRMFAASLRTVPPTLGCTLVSF